MPSKNQKRTKEIENEFNYESIKRKPTTSGTC